MYLFFLFVTRCRRGGTIEMTIVLLYVILSVCVSITHLVPPTSFIGYFWNFEDFLFLSFYMRMYIWYWIFDPIISDIITALVNWEIAIFKACVHNSIRTSFIGFFWNCACFLIIIWRFACGFKLLSLFHSNSLMRLYYPKLRIMAHTLTSYRFIHCSLKHLY